MKSAPAEPHHAVSKSAQSFFVITIEQLTALGISRATIYRKLSKGEWKTAGAEQSQKSAPSRTLCVSSLPTDLQLRIFQRTFITDDSGQLPSGVEGLTEYPAPYESKKLSSALLRFSPDEQTHQLAEAVRLSGIIARYDAIKVKRKRNTVTGKYEYVQEVLELCREAACKDHIIIVREPHRAAAPSPHTLDGWSRLFRNLGLLAFLRCGKLIKPAKDKSTDRRRITFSSEAIEWLNSNWDKFKNARRLREGFIKEAKLRRWNVPSDSWFFRIWRSVPAVVKVLRLEGRRAYESKLAPYLPRDYSDLQALQLLCGDHSERDVTISLPDGTIRRPWVTIWYDLRTGLIWGCHLSLSPSSHTAGLAYADGVRNFGAQPFSRPDDEFFSYIYTDRGRDYRSHNWDGKVLTVHKEAMRPDGGLEALLVQQRVGIVEELGLKHLLTRGKNPKENPVERVHGIISEWERNTFEGYCGRNPSTRPEKWHKLYIQHQRFKRGGRDSSPFITLDEYQEQFAEFVTFFNTMPHVRTTLGGKQVVPLEEFHRLYTTRYKIDEGTLALILMKPATRRINRNGVQLFQKGWNYLHESMLGFVKAEVEVRYTEGDYNTVFVILPDKQICEATRITPSSVINPNKYTLKTIANARAHEKRINEQFHLIAQSRLRGETTEDRVAHELVIGGPSHEMEGEPAQTASIHLLTRMSRKKLSSVLNPNDITATDVAKAETDTSIFDVSKVGNVREFDYED